MVLYAQDLGHFLQKEQNLADGESETPTLDGADGVRISVPDGLWLVHVRVHGSAGAEQACGLET